MKRWGKSPPHVWRQIWQGKPYELKDHVYRGLRAARSISEGRLIDLNCEVEAREMIDS